MLAAAECPDTIIEAVPELSDANTLARSLAYLRGSFPSQDPVVLLEENPRLLLNLGESNMEDSAEYGEMTTKVGVVQFTVPPSSSTTSPSSDPPALSQRS